LLESIMLYYFLCQKQ